MDSEGHRILADLLLEWEDRFAEGIDLPATELAREHPEVTRELDRRIQALKAMHWLDHPVPDEDLGPSPDHPASAPPPLAGRYRLDERIGVGGFAEVWRGFDLQLERVVAIKLPKASAITGSEAFLAEARRVAALQHPHIVTVHDIGQDGDRWFIVSEFVPGGSLAASLARGPIPRGDAVRWVAQVADALDTAHHAGLVHCDVKPENILIDSAGDALLTDFGIARAQRGPDPATAGIGTLRAMAPEQLAGDSLTPATDVYALGLVLHEVLTGRQPFRSTAPAGIRGEIADGIAAQVTGGIPLRLAAVCRRALARDPSHRYQTARVFARAIRRATRLTGPWPVAAAVLLAGLFALTVVFTWPSPPSAGIQRDGTLALLIPMRRPPKLQVDATGRISLRCSQIHDLNPYVIEADNVRIYYEWQDPPISYVGPALNEVEGRVVYRFDVDRPIAKARLLCTVFGSDGTIEPNVIGRGAGAVDISNDGTTWVGVCDSLEPLRLGEDHAIDATLPKEVLGGTSLWVRVRLLTTGSLKTRYTTAQFGRDFFDGFPFLEGVFGLDLKLAD